MAIVDFDVDPGDLVPGDDLVSDVSLAKRDITAKFPLFADAIGGKIAELEDAGNGGFVERHEHGAMYWKRGCGAQCVSGSLYDHYIVHGGPVGWLGYPVTSLAAMPDGVGWFNDFQAGSIFWSAGSGVHEVHGEIRDKWRQHVAELGYPITDESGCPDNVGRFNHFERGSVYWTPDTGANFIRGKIRDRWQILAWEQGYLGYPISDEENVTVGATPLTRNRFQRGIIQMGGADDTALDIADSIVFESGPIETEETVGGRVSLRMDSQGHWSWEGHMHNSGFVALAVGVATRLNFVDAAGNVFMIPAEEMNLAGTTSPGSRTHMWDKSGQDLKIRDNWDGLKNGGMTTRVEIGTTAAEVISLILLGIVVVGAIVFFSGPPKDSKICQPIGEPEGQGSVLFWDKGSPEPTCPPGQQ